MKKTIIAIMAIMICAAAAQAEPVLLRYKHSVGDHLVYIFTMDGGGTMEMSMPGVDLPESMTNMKLDSSLVMNLETDVTAVEDGIATLESKITRCRMSQNGMTVIDYQADVKNEDESGSGMMDMFSDTLEIKMDALGDVKDFKGFEKLSQLSQGMDLGELLSRMQQPLPEEPVDIGGTWTQEIKMGEGDDAQTMVANFEVVGRETVKDLDCLKIKSLLSGDMSDFMEAIVSQFPMASGVDVEYMVMDVDGFLFFEPNAGVVVAMEFKMKQDMAVSMEIENEGQTNFMKMKMNMVLDGVYELE